MAQTAAPCQPLDPSAITSPPSRRARDEGWPFLGCPPRQPRRGPHQVTVTIQPFPNSRHHPDLQTPPARTQRAANTRARPRCRAAQGAVAVAQPGATRAAHGDRGWQNPELAAAKGSGDISVTLGSLSRTSRCPGAPRSHVRPLASCRSHHRDRAQTCCDTTAAAAASEPQFPHPRAGPSRPAQAQQHEQQTGRAFLSPLCLKHANEYG